MYPKWPTRTVTQLFFSLWFRIKYANDLNKYFLHERRRNLNFLPFSFFIRSSRPEVFCKKSFLKSFVKLSVENQCQTRSFSVNFAKFSRTPPVIAFSNFKAPGFTEAVMQMNVWITHDLVHLSILSCSWHFCIYFPQAQAFRITTASLTLDVLYSFESWDIMSLSCHMTKWSMYHVTLWVGFPHPKSPPS